MDWKIYEKIDNNIYKAVGMLGMIQSGTTKDEYSHEELCASLWAVQEMLEEVKEGLSELWQNRKVAREEQEDYLNVELAEEHEDGSATYSITMPKDQQNKLFSAFFINGLSRGIGELEVENEYVIRNLEVRRRAQALVNILNEWEVTDELDYDPKVKQIKAQLEESLRDFPRIPKSLD